MTKILLCYQIIMCIIQITFSFFFFRRFMAKYFLVKIYKEYTALIILINTHFTLAVIQVQFLLNKYVKHLCKFIYFYMTCFSICMYDFVLFCMFVCLSFLFCCVFFLFVFLLSSIFIFFFFIMLYGHWNTNKILSLLSRI